jgi:hypothetical protein
MRADVRSLTKPIEERAARLNKFKKKIKIE